MSIRNSLPQSIKRPIRKLINFATHILNSIKYRCRKMRRKISPDIKPGYDIAILCVKKTVYADMLFDHVNSLHYFNPNHTYHIYCDTLCNDYLQKWIKKFSYPDKVIVKDEYGIADKPWQHYKIEVHIQAAWNDQIDTDADSIWHSDLFVDREKVTMLVNAYQMKTQPNEVILLKEIFNKPEWADFHHRVAAFLSLPKKFMNKKIENDFRSFNNILFNNTLYFIKDRRDRESMHRLSEEFAVNLTIQTNFPQNMITTLKESDERGDKNTLQSIYYGCINNVAE